MLLLYFNSCQQENASPYIDKPETKSTDDVVLINVHVEITIGGIPYQNLDAPIRIIGYDSGNTRQWKEDFDAIGPIDTLHVKNGFHHYSIELVDKWGIHDIQSEISGEDLWDARADGPLPFTYVLGGSKEAKKLLKYETSRETSIPGTGIVYQPQSRVKYTYREDGRVDFIAYEIYNSVNLVFEAMKTETFHYEGEVLSKINTTVNEQLNRVDEYFYGTENKIVQQISGLTLTQTTHYVESNRVQIDYEVSNGNSFAYAFDIREKNIARDKTTKPGQLCSEGMYTYDKNINPFRHLGYMDFNLQNWSASNKLTEQVEYKACSFPTLIPVWHRYVYDVDGYPTEKITTYQSGSPQQTSPYHSKVEYYYE